MSLRAEDEEPETDVVTAYPPIYLMTTVEICWKCEADTAVVAFASEDIHEGMDRDDCDGPIAGALSGVRHLPAALLSEAQKHSPGYRRVYASEVGEDCYMNHCLACGARLDDLYLHMEPGSAFFPTSDEEFERVRLVPLPADEPVSVRAEWGPCLVQEFLDRRVDAEAGILTTRG